jgi:acyl-coenzyme A synthetase/AMP-(fatty) acid ligase
MSDIRLNLFQVVATRPAEYVFGWRNGLVINAQSFRSRVAAWRGLLTRTTGQNFALYYEDSLEFAAALLGAWHAGKTVWLVADTLIASCISLKQSVDGFLGEFPEEFDPLVPDGDQTLSPYESVTIDADFIALVVQTSGTTGVSLSIPKRLSQLLSEVATLEVVFGELMDDAEIVATVSHQHIYGLLFKVIWPLVAGRAIHVRSQYFPEELAQLLSHRPCVLITSPAHLKRLPESVLDENTRHCLRTVFSSGGPLSVEVANNTENMLGQIPIEIYGSSETGGIAWRQRLAGSDESWQPLPQVEWRIAELENLLEVRSPHLFDDQWMRLADLAREHSQGKFFLDGRGDRIVKIEEKRISLDAIEALLMASPFVSEVRIALCDSELGQRQRLAAFIVASEAGKKQLVRAGKLKLNRELLQLFSGNLEPIAFPRRWRYLEKMPVNSQGKTSHASLMALLNERPRTPYMCLSQRDAYKVELELNVPADLLYFDGHFEGAPVLPGVVQLDWAISNARQYFDIPAEFRGIHALKFQHVICPDSALRLELIYDPLKGILNFRYFSAGGQHSSGRVLFTLESHG